MANNDVIVRLRLAGEDFEREFKIKFEELSAAAEKASAQSGTRAGSSFGKSFATALGAAGAAIGLAINQAANLGAELSRTSRELNIGVENFQIWRKAAGNAGISADQLRDGLVQLTQKIGEANAGNRQAQQAFAGLGISFKTASGEARATDAVMLDLARRIAAIEDPSERIRRGTQLLGDQFKTLYPLLLDGAEGFEQTASEARRFGEVLTQKEIEDLDTINRKIEDLKNQLSRSIAKTVAENADAILGLADAIGKLTSSIVRYANEYPAFAGALGGAVMGARVGGPWGAAAGALGGLVAGDLYGDWRRERNVDYRARQLRAASERVAATRKMPGGANNPFHYRALQERDRELARYGTALLGDMDSLRAELRAAHGGGGGTGGGGGGTGGGGSSGGGRGRTGSARAARQSDAERADREALRNEERLREALERTRRELDDAAEVQRIRAELGEVAAARAEAELGFLRQHPLAIHETVESLGKALGYSDKMIEARRQELQVLLDLAKADKQRMGDAAAAAAEAERERDKQRQDALEDARRDAEKKLLEREYERAVLNLANFYETAFRGGTRDLWRAFRDEGTRIIAELAAQWTLAMLSGGRFDLNSALAFSLARSPLQSLFFGAGRRGGFDAALGGAANDNGPSLGRTMTDPGGGRNGGPPLPSGGVISNGQVPRTPFLQSPAFALGIGSLAPLALGAGGMAGQIGGLAGALGGQKLGASIAALGKFGGPVGAVAGALIGTLVGGLFKSTKKGSATVGSLGGELGITGVRGNSGSRKGAASSSAGNLIDAIFQIAERLGGTVDASRASVSIGMRKNDWVVDPGGRGATKARYGAVNFGSDQEAAIRFAISDLIKDGVITGISQASQNLLRRGGNLDKQIEKALLIEQIPKLLRQRLDPLGAALDELYEKFRKVNEALVEGSASAEQFAQARQLWELEKADAIASIGAASQSLKDFLAALNAGSASPLSLREQRAEAERQLAPYLDQIARAESARAEVERLRAGGASAAEIAAAEQAARTAAAAINQEGFVQASQLLLSISRQSNASSGAFFADFDRIRALTGQAIGFVDQASAREADTRDPFARAIAQNTQDAATILAEHTVILNRILSAINDNGAAPGIGTSGFVYENRAFAL
jgi:hypothetical protein